MACECCGRVEVDEVAHVLVEEAVIMLARAREEKLAEDRAAWDEAEAAAAAAQAGAS